MNNKFGKAVLAYAANANLSQRVFNDFDGAYAKMAEEYNETLKYNGLYRGKLKTASASISYNGQSIAKWNIKMTKEPSLPKSACTMITISTAHIDADAAQALEEGYDGFIHDGYFHSDIGEIVTYIGEIVAYPKTEYGWFIYIPDDDTRSNLKCINDIIDYCRKNEIGMVCLDSDGDIIPDLPTYAWN